MSKWEPTKLPEFDVWESRRYELAKQYFFEAGVHNYDKAVEYADEFIAAMKKSHPEEDPSSTVVCEPKNGL